MPPYPGLLSPLVLPATTLRNRVVMGSMHTRLEHGDDPVRRAAAFYAARARGGVAMIVTGGYAPNREGLMEPGAPLIDTPAAARELRPVVEAVHAHGAKFLLQILHAGRYAMHSEVVGASAIASPINPRVPRPLTPADIERTIADFVRTAELAAEAGFDGVEVMGSEGYLLNQFTAPRTNDRTDEWGGSMANRIRLPAEIVRRTRARLGAAFIIMYRISALDLVEGGLDGEEIDAQARAVEAAGADILSTGIGWHEARVPTIAYSVPRGAWRFAAERLKRAVAIPVMASNRINTPETAEEILARGEADLVSMARPLLADPDFVVKAAAGRGGDINTCIACNQACLDYIFSERTATCLVNPRAGRETGFDAPAVRAPRRIAVVGAGPAGLACAAEAAGRGHRVTLFEAADRVGGQFHLAARVPGKSEYLEHIRYCEHRLAATGVETRLGVRATAQMLEGYDRVVVATGVLPRVPEIPGIDNPKVVSYIDVLSGRVRPGPRVAILGTGGIGFDVAAYLLHEEVSETEALATFFARWGVDPAISTRGGLRAPLASRPPRAIHMLQRRSTRPGERLGVSTGWILRAEIRRHGVKFTTGCAYRRIDEAGVHVTVDGEDRLIEADTVVLCAGQEPAAALLDELRARGVRADAIGGAARAAELDALRAIEEGTALALAI